MRVVHVELTNEDRGFAFSAFTEEPPEDLSIGDIYRFAQREYGRCRSSVYVEHRDGPDKRIGWFFVKRCRYEDTGESYLQGAWVTVCEEQHTRAWIDIDDNRRS